jgi:hypothetical protein
MARCKAEATYRIPRTLSRNSSSNSVIEVRTVGIERGVHHLDQIALDGRGLVLGGGECHYDLERVFGCAASSTLEAGSASTRMGFDDGADVFQRRLKLGPLRDREAHLGT